MSSPFPPNDDLSNDQQADPIYSPVYPEFPPADVVFPSEPPEFDGPQGNLAATFFSWVVIVGMTSLMFGLVFVTSFFAGDEETVASASEIMQANFQGKINVGVKAFLEEADQPNAAEADQGIELLNAGPPEQRFCYAILVCELDGPEDAYGEIVRIQNEMENTEGFSATEDQTRMAQLLATLFDSYSTGEWDSLSVVSTDDQDFLKEKLGWAAGLALHPEKGPDKAGRRLVVSSARTTFLLVVLLGLALCGLCVAGLVGSIVMLVMLFNGSMKSRFTTSNGRGGIYAETFAIWMVVFFLGSLSLALLHEVTGMSAVCSTFAQLAVFFGSLIVLVYPMIRGVPWSVVRQDIGWKMQNPVAEVATGGISYVTIMPLLVVGMLITAILAMIVTMFVPEASHQFVSSGSGSHPIENEIASGNPLMILGVFLTACLAAPIVEETMFRGVLYQHLRAREGWMPRVALVIFSGLISSFIFAAIHPQGIAGIPFLMALAFGFVLIREWRGSLIAPMTMHAIHNFIVTCFLLLML